MYIDLTHTFITDMPVFPGDSPVEFRQISAIHNAGYTNTQITTNMHVGTHIDAPYHMLVGSKKLSDFPVEKFIGRAHILDARGKNSLDVELLENIKFKPGDSLLIVTGWGHEFRNPNYFDLQLTITDNFATRLIEEKIKMFGLDAASVDTPPHAIHKLLLGAEILIIENLTNLEALLEYKTFELVALPLKMAADGSPARVIAKI